MSDFGPKSSTLVKGWAFATALAATSLLAGTASAAHNPAPHPNPPTLHGFCDTSNPCTDNGTNTPTGVNPPEFGFSAGGHAATGDVTLDFLVPDNVTLPASYTVSGPFLGASTFTATLVSNTPWTSGQLDSYLGISASPTNPIGAFLPSTLTYQPGATGFYVFSADIGTVTLPANNANADVMTTSLSLWAGSYIVAFINQNGAYGATANSGAILETGACGPDNCGGNGGGGGGGVPEPATWALMLLGMGGLGGALRSKRRFASMIA